MSRKVLVGGGTGFIGSALSQMLINRGYIVTVISRTSGKNRLTWNDISKNGIPEDTFAVINLAGENILNPFRRFNEDFKKTVVESRIKTTTLLADAIRNASKKPDVFLSMSGVGIYKPDPSKEYDENTHVGNSFDFISRLALDWEKASETAENVRRVILRSGVVLGRNGGMIKQIYLPYYLFLGSWFGSGYQFFPWIHLHDLCRLIIFSLENEQVKGVLNCVAPEIIDHRTFSKTFGAALWRLIFLSTPEFVCKMIFGSERSVMLLEGQKVIPHKAVEVYQFKYRYPTIQKASEEFAPFKYTPPPLIY